GRSAMIVATGTARTRRRPPIGRKALELYSKPPLLPSKGLPRAIPCRRQPIARRTRPAKGEPPAMPDQAITLSDDIFADLRKIETPTITNVVATYPKNHPGAALYGPPDPNFAGRRLFLDVVHAPDAMKKPTILVIQQKWPPELHNKAGLAGEMMVSSMMVVGCIGMISNGPSRDIDAIRKLRFQLLLGGVTAGHGELAGQPANVPVSVGGCRTSRGGA